jgi:hypothetical protein
MHKLLGVLILLAASNLTSAQKVFSVEYPNQAKKKIYFVEYENQADLKIYFVEYENQAWWKSKKKMHLMY